MKNIQDMSFTILTKFLMATELQAFVLVRVTVNTPLVRASVVRITQTQTNVVLPVMLQETKISRQRPRRGQGSEVKAKAEAEVEANFLRSRPKIVMNKKYQMMTDSIQVNLYHYDQNDTV